MPVGKKAVSVVKNNRGCGQNCNQQSLTDVGRPTPFNKCLLIPEALEASSNQQYRLKWHVAFWEQRVGSSNLSAPTSYRNLVFTSQAFESNLPMNQLGVRLADEPESGLGSRRSR